MKWKDITSYSQSDKERKPSAWEIRNNNIRITITCGHIHYRPEWIMHCYALGIDTKELTKGINKQQAKDEALKIVYNAAKKLKANVEEILNSQL